MGKLLVLIIPIAFGLGTVAATFVGLPSDEIGRLMFGTIATFVASVVLVSFWED